jgi:hypothetical protein
MDVKNLSHDEFVELLGQELKVDLTIVRTPESALNATEQDQGDANNKVLAVHEGSEVHSLDLSRGSSMTVLLQRPSFETKMGVKMGMLLTG